MKFRIWEVEKKNDHEIAQRAFFSNHKCFWVVTDFTGNKKMYSLELPQSLKKVVLQHDVYRFSEHLSKKSFCWNIIFNINIFIR